METHLRDEGIGEEALAEPEGVDEPHAMEDAHEVLESALGHPRARSFRRHDHVRRPPHHETTVLHGAELPAKTAQGILQVPRE